MERAKYLLILIDKMPPQGSEWLKTIVLDRLSPEAGGKPYREQVDLKTKIEAVEVGEQDFSSWMYVTMAASMLTMSVWGNQPDLDNLRWQPFAGKIGKGVVIQM